MGLDVELERGLGSPKTNVAGDDSNVTGKVVLAHLNEFPDYYTRMVGPEPCTLCPETLRLTKGSADWCGGRLSPAESVSGATSGCP